MVRVLLCLVLIGIFLPAHLTAQEMPPAQVEVTFAEMKSLSPTLELQGNVISRQDAIISSQVEGQLLSIVDVGTMLKKGDVIAVLDSEILKLQLIREESNLASLQSDLTYRNNEVNRFQTLAKKDNASKTQLQLELSLRERLENDIQIAQANIAEAKRHLRDSKIVAPFEGVMAEQLAQQGEFLVVGDEIGRLVNLSSKDVAVATPMSALDIIKINDPISIIVQDQPLSLPVRSIVPVGDLNSRMFEIRLKADNSQLHVGGAVKALVPKVKPIEIVAIPRDALIIRGTQTFVYKVDDNKRALQAQAKVAFSVDQWVAIESGVEQGEQIITRGAERLMPGQALVF